MTEGVRPQHYVNNMKNTYFAQVYMAPGQASLARWGMYCCLCKVDYINDEDTHAKFVLTAAIRASDSIN